MRRPYSILLSLLCLLLLCPDGTAAVLRVKADAPGPARDGAAWETAFATIQAGLDAAAPGDEVWVATYPSSSPSYYMEQIVIPAGVSLYGGFAGGETERPQRDPVANRVFLSASAPGQTLRGPLVRFEAGASPSTVLDGMYILGGWAEDGDPAAAAGIRCVDASPTITNNDIRSSNGSAIVCVRSTATIARNSIANGSATKGAAVYCGEGGAPLVYSNRFFENRAGRASVLLCAAGSSPRFRNNTLLRNRGSVAAVSVEAGATAEIVNNIIAFDEAVAIEAATGAAGGITLRNNCFHANSRGNVRGLPDPVGTDGNIAADPKMVNAAYGSIAIAPDSPCVDAGDDSVVPDGAMDLEGQQRVQGARVDIGADESDGTEVQSMARVFHVKPDGDDSADGLTWETAWKTLIRVAGGARGDDEVWVAEGVYLGKAPAFGSLGSVLEIPRGVSVLGGFAGNEAARDQRDPERHVTILDGNQNPYVVAGLQGTWGRALLDGFTVRNSAGAPNQTAGVQGGNILIRRCILTGHQGVAVQLQDGGILEDCKVVDNPGMGVAVALGTATVRGNLVARNGGGISTAIYARMFVENNRVQSNHSPPQLFPRTLYPVVAGIHCRNGSVARNNVVAGNSGFGAGITIQGGQPASALGYALNNTIVANTGEGSEGALVIVDSNGTSSEAVNNIVAFNSMGVEALGGSAATIRNNCVFGNTKGNYAGVDLTGLAGNISADPLLVSIIDGEFHLQPGSPCVDAGDDAVLSDGDRDVEGKPRLLGPHVDIGAYEFLPPEPGILGDALRALRLAAGLETATSEDLTDLDADASQRIDIVDAARLLRRAIGLDKPE